jgi:exopolysaccharide production protein ExoY
VLRKLSVDELPQLFNILLGQMSVVGPRPVVADELDKYRASTAHYLRTRPGLTGLWQVSGRNDTSYGTRVLLDRFYVCRWSMLLDLWIIFRTFPAVLSSRGAR